MTVLAALALLAWADAARAVPNVVVIVTDDHRADGTMDTTAMAKTRAWFETGSHPVLGPVPAGTAFPNGVATTPLCCPARSTIFTGQYVHNHGVLDNLKAENILDDKTLQEYLKGHGYRTGLFGKYLNGWEAKPQFGGDPTKKCEDPVTLATISCWDQWATFEGQYFPVTVNDQGTSKRVLQYSTDYLADRAVSFIQASGSTPFFLYVAPTAPHHPFLPEPEFESAAIPSFEPIRADPKYLEADRSDKPQWARKRYMGEQEVIDNRADQLRTLYSVDAMVDDIVRKVREVPGRDDNTIMFFLGDNGLHWGDHGRSGKTTAYEDSVKVPFYMRWPSHPSQVPAGSNPSLVGNIDLAPTIMDAVDASPAPGEPMDGQSLVDPAQRDPSNVLKRNRQFTQFHGLWKSLRTRDFVYIESIEATGAVFKEYYDIRVTPDPSDVTDPSEVTNLLADGDSSNDPPTDNIDPAVNSLHEQLLADAACANTSCPGAGDPAVFPADTKITVKPDPNTNSTTADFVFTSSVPGSSFECKLSPPATTFSNCGGARDLSTPGQPYKKQFTGLTPDEYTLEVKASAPGGSPDSTPDAHTWTVDTTPDTRIVGPKPPKLTNNPTAQFSFTSTTGSANFDCKLEGKPPAGHDWEQCTSPRVYVESQLPDGEYTFSVAAPNDPTPATHTWEVDTTLPVVTMNYPAENLEAASSELTFVPFADGDVQGFRCSLDGGAAKPCGGQGDTETLTGLTNGNHTLRVTATDFAGNQSAPLDRHFSVTTVPTYSNTPEPGPEITDLDPNSEVRTVIPDGNQGWYIGGLFSSVAGIPKTNIAHINSSGSVDSWAPTFNAPVNSMALGPDGTLYIVGEFTSVNGSPRGRTAAFSTSAGAPGVLLPWNPNADWEVNDIKVGSDVAYIAGEFNLVSGVIHRRIAEVEPAGSGTATDWGLSLNYAFQSGPLELYTLELTPSSVYAGGKGTLSNNGSQRRTNLAEISRTTGTITNWLPQPDAEVQSLHLSPDGSTIFVGGKFTTIGGGNTYSAAEIRLSDAGTAGFAPRPRFLPPGLPGTGNVNDIVVRDLAPGAPTASRRLMVLLGGTFDNLKTRYERAHVTDASVIGDSFGNGWPGDWNPRLDLPGTKVNDFAISGNVLAVAGNFSAAHFTVRRDLMFFRLP